MRGRRGLGVDTPVGDLVVVENLREGLVALVCLDDGAGRDG